MEAVDEGLLNLRVLTLGDRKGVARLPRAKRRTILEQWLAIS
jgi:hypothetical protein